MGATPPSFLGSVSDYGRKLRPALAAWPLFLLSGALVVAVPHTPLRAIGPLTAALLVGIALRAPLARSAAIQSGLPTLARDVLRFAVVLTGLRLDWIAVARAGVAPLAVAAAAVGGGLVLFKLLARVLGAPMRLGALVAIGSSVCGAAAITAAGPVVEAEAREIQTGIAIVSLLGAAESLLLIALHGAGLLPADLYGLVTGGALHEVAHVIAAGTAVPAALGIATVTKLARVALLPVALLLLPWWMGRRARSRGGAAPVPGLVIGFLAVSALGTAGAFVTREAPALAAGWGALTSAVAVIATVLLGASMTAIGAQVDLGALRSTHRGALVFASVGSLILLGLVLSTAHLAGSAP